MTYAADTSPNTSPLPYFTMSNHMRIINREELLALRPGAVVQELLDVNTASGLLERTTSPDESVGPVLRPISPGAYVHSVGESAAPVKYVLLAPKDLNALAARLLACASSHEVAMH